MTESSRASKFDANLARVPQLDVRVRAGQRESPVTGTHMLPNYFRQAHGPGWTLLGDAALHRDPITAQGITNAFTQAAILAEQLDRAFGGERTIDEATARYDERQFSVLKPMFDYQVHLATMQPLLPELAAQVPALAADRDAAGAFIGAFLGSVHLREVFPPAVLERFEQDVNRNDAENRRAA